MKPNEKEDESLVEEIKSLLEERESFGDTPLHFALRTEEFQAAQYLLKCIATNEKFQSVVNLKNSSGKVVDFSMN